MLVGIENLDNVRPNRGGKFNPAWDDHAPGFLRDAFCEWIEGGAKETTVEIDDERKPLRWLVDQLWNYSDIQPRTECEDLEIPRGSTYAEAVRNNVVRSVIARADP